MSSFSGKIDECNWIWIDQFENIDLEPAEMAITKGYDEVFNVLPTNEDNYESLAPVKVTFLDAQHCPGSSMILFEFPNGNKSLYTGDFRILKQDWYSYTPLIDPTTNTGFKSINTLYFDSTFCRKGTINIPTREQSINIFLKLVSEWLAKNPCNKVLIWGSCYGQEFLFRAIWERLGLQCHVAADKYRIYSKISEYADCVTWSANSARVHACTTGFSAMDECYIERNQCIIKSKFRKSKPHIFPCDLCRPDNKTVRVIRPSVIWFARRNEKDVIGYDHNYFCRLLYSNHCSFNEIVDTFKILRPNRAFPNVLDNKFALQHAENIMKHLKIFLRQAETEMDPKEKCLKQEELEEHESDLFLSETALAGNSCCLQQLQEDVIVIDDDDT
uniref:Protein artemis n=1 Tax=Syphacia muris TaxID=451379 RepID=A0A0N5AGY5_9BILA